MDAVIEVGVGRWAGWGILALRDETYGGQDAVTAAVAGDVGRRDGRHERCRCVVVGVDVDDDDDDLKTRRDDEQHWKLRDGQQ